MPVVTDEPAAKRRIPVWIFALVLILFPLGVLFTWSWFQPVVFRYQFRGIAFGRVSGYELGVTPTQMQQRRWVGEIRPGNAWKAYRLPGNQHNRWYGVGLSWN